MSADDLGEIPNRSNDGCLNGEYQQPVALGIQRQQGQMRSFLKKRTASAREKLRGRQRQAG